MPSPLSAATVSPARAAASPTLARVVEVARVDALARQAVAAQRALDRGRDAAGLAAAGGWVHDQADGVGTAARLVS